MATRISEIRKERGISQKDLAKMLGIYPSNLSNWENGYTEPNLTQLVQVADFLQVSVDELLGRENFATGNIEIVGENLNFEEKTIVQNFRNANGDGRKMMLEVSNTINKLYAKGRH